MRDLVDRLRALAPTRVVLEATGGYELHEDFSPALVVGWFARFTTLVISHETIYRYVRADKKAGGNF